MPTLTTFLMFNDKAEEAVNLYLGLFDGKITHKVPGPNNTVSGVEFEMLGRAFVAFNGGPHFKFSEGISLMVSCESQSEIDRFWSKLTADGGKESRCGWLTDKFGVSWQIVPKELGSLLGHKDREKAGRALQAMLSMQKLDIAALQRAFDGK
jgi:predicted 3-demethylubiquinone-9 3-methyltransferase (glyoxalase superfamily)